MPLYDYQCRKCNHLFEHEHRIGENPRVRCPICKGAAKKLISPVGVVFKGSGFYCTDNKKKSGGNGSSVKGETVEVKKTKDSSEDKPSSDD